MLLFLFILLFCAWMYKLIFIAFIFIYLSVHSCSNVEQISNTQKSEVAPKDSFISSVIFLAGSDLEFKFYSRGCFHEETQRVEISQMKNKQIVVSYFRNDEKILDQKVVDSSFGMAIRLFLFQCDKLLNYKPPVQYGFGTIETIHISDGLDIIEVSTDQSKSRNPFKDLVYAMNAKAEKLN